LTKRSMRKRNEHTWFKQQLSSDGKSGQSENMEKPKMGEKIRMPKDGLREKRNKAEKLEARALLRRPESQKIRSGQPEKPSWGSQNVNVRKGGGGAISML